ncbi:hypothetical protein QZH41_005472 [Actinostola sp. cb2023]|nr:hypothetical protein QZH41_005472 [Actinostola sp. cb2023]
MTLAILLPLGILGFLITLETLLVCFLVARVKSLRTFTNGFVVSLAVADLLYGAVVIPMYIGNGPRMALSYMVTIVLLANISTLLSVTFDRYLIVLHPLVYKPLMEKHFYKIIIASWVFPVGISLVPLLYSSNYSHIGHKIFVYFIVIIGVVVPYIAILLAYAMIFHRVARHVKYLALNNRNDDDSEERQEGRRVTAEANVAKIFVIIAIIFIISWLPIVYMTVVNNIGRYDLIPGELAIASWFTLSIGSLVNAPIYAFAKKDFNTAIRKIICPTQRRETMENNVGEEQTQTDCLEKA